MVVPELREVHLGEWEGGLYRIKARQSDPVYLRMLADRDLALDRSMIPLGSCTMKLNATSEMIPVTWPEFGRIHPFAPADQWAGYREMISQLEAWLCACTGYDAVWLAEHHFSTYGYLSRPLTYAMHLANKTKRLRIGTAVIVLPLHHPLVVAEEIAYSRKLYIKHQWASIDVTLTMAPFAFSKGSPPLIKSGFSEVFPNSAS